MASEEAQWQRSCGINSGVMAAISVKVIEKMAKKYRWQYNIKIEGEMAPISISNGNAKYAYQWHGGNINGNIWRINTAKAKSSISQCESGNRIK